MAVLAVVSAIYAHALSQTDQRFFVGWASTNLANLASRPLPSLVVSAFLSVDPIIVWAVLTTGALILLVRRFGNRRSAILAVTAHVAGTLVSEGITAWRLAVGSAPAAVRHIADVGPSYVTVSALIAVAVFGQVRWHRVVALAGWAVLAPFLFEGIAAFNVAAIGHVVSMLVGVFLGACFQLDRRRSTRPHSPSATGNRPAGGAATARQYRFPSHLRGKTSRRGYGDSRAHRRSPEQEARSR